MSVGAGKSEVPCWDGLRGTEGMRKSRGEKIPLGRSEGGREGACGRWGWHFGIGLFFLHRCVYIDGSS